MQFPAGQAKGLETFSCFHTRLRSLATWTVSQIPYGTKLCEKTSTYLASWKAGRTLEWSEIQTKELEKHDQTVNVVKFDKKGTSTHLKGIQHHQQNRQESRTCHEWIAATPEETMVNVGTVVDHTFTETHALRKTRSANPAETKPFCSCLQKKFTWVSKTRHIWRHSWKWRICLHDRRWQAAKLQSQENRWKWWSTPAHRSIAWTHPQGVIQTEGSTSHQAQNFLPRIIHTFTYSGNYWGRNIR